MDRAALIKQLMEVFLGELEEHVRTQNRDLLALESAPTEDDKRELLRGLLRTAHSLKGAARAVDIEPIERLCHELEELMSEACEGRRPLDKDLFTRLFAGADALHDAGRRLREGQSLKGTLIDTSITLVSGAALPLAAPPPLALDAPASAPAEPASASPAPSRRSGQEFGQVRVAARRLDALLAASGELALTRARLASRKSDVESIVELVSRWRVEWQKVELPLRKLAAAERGRGGRLPARLERSLGRARDLFERMGREIEQLSAAMAADRRAFEHVYSIVDDEVRHIRMLPFAEACQGLARMVRDLSHEQGKQVELVVKGGEVAVDRSILEGLKDPLVHLARNAVDHGVEPPAERRAAGKPVRGCVEICVALRGAQVEVSVSDDGAGLDAEAIAARARDKGLPLPQSPADLPSLIFLPGFSTSRALTVVSGRGVGLDVVKSRVESLHGQVDVESERGKGTRFVLTMPLTVTSIRAVLVEAAGQTFAIPSTSVERLMRLREATVRKLEGRTVMTLADAALPVAPLASLLGLPARELGPGSTGARIVVISGRGHAAGLVVDALVGVEEILVKSLGRRLRHVRYVSGATLLPTGQLALILTPGELVAAAARPGAGELGAPAIGRAIPSSKKRILVVDDSVTTRSLGKSILEAAGFEVVVATDGQEALRVLEERGADLVLSDVEMPRMDGLALTEAIRASRRFERLPVILLTGLGSERDKARGLEVGADAYLVKSAFDTDQLLETIAQLL
jgi:two-component system chemotaxis sensor kinase CheA